MSALWVLALGASIGYMSFKQQNIMGQMESARKEYEAGAAPSEPQPPEGASLKEIKDAHKYTEDTRNLDFNERLPAGKRRDLLRASDQQAELVRQYDQGSNPPQHIEGVYLEQICAS